MGKCFRFLGGLGLMSACGGMLHGTPYPSLNDIRSYLRSKGGTGTAVTEAFKSACESEDARLIGEANGALTSPNGLALRHYNPNDYRDWQWKFGTIYGFFSCTVQGVSVFNEETLRKAVEKSEEDRLARVLTRADTEKIAEITKICRVLLSEEFAKRLLTEPLVKALYDNKDAAYSCFDVEFSPDTSEKNVFRFGVTYSQIIKEEARREKSASVFAVCFRFAYDFEKRDFGGKRWDDIGKRFVPRQPQLECLEVDGEAFRSSLCDFNERIMARVWQHPFAERGKHGGEETVPEKEKDVFGEERRRNSEENGKALGLEEDEEDLKVYSENVKEGKARKECDPNKHPRTPQSEDEKSDGVFKKKKE